LGLTLSSFCAILGHRVIDNEKQSFKEVSMRLVLAAVLVIVTAGCSVMRSTARTPTSSYDSWSVGVSASAAYYGSGYYGTMPYAPVILPSYRVPMWRAPSESWSSPSAPLPAPPPIAAPALSRASATAVSAVAASVPTGAPGADEARLKAVEEKANDALKAAMKLESYISKKGKKP